MIKNNLRELMQKKGVTITELHNILNISRPTLTKMANDETDGIRYDTINKLCKFFKISPNELLVFVPFDNFSCIVLPTEPDGKCLSVNPRDEIKRIEKENTGQLTNLNIALFITLSFDENDFIYISSEVKYLSKKLLYASFELKQSRTKEKEFFQFVRDTDPNFKDQVKREMADHTKKVLMLDNDVDVVIVADFMRILEGKE